MAYPIPEEPFARRLVTFRLHRDGIPIVRPQPSCPRTIVDSALRGAPALDVHAVPLRFFGVIVPFPCRSAAFHPRSRMQANRPSLQMLRHAGVALSLLLCASGLDAQEIRTIRGVVTDSAGAPLAGATVGGSSNRSGVVTGPSGAFRVRVPAEEVRLVASRVGYEPDTAAIGPGSSRVTFRLVEAPLSLEGVVVSAERSYSAASSRVVRELDLHLRPRQSSQELLRLAPGLVIAQHAGGGKAEQIFLRGFDADHGTDVAISVDGLPVNMVSHAHGQGYADLHFVIPELVERVEVRKGPYDVRDGDFATAGAVHFRTRERISGPHIRARAGSFGTGYLFAALPVGGSATRPGGFVAASGLHSDGPFEVPQDHRRVNLFGKWTAPLGEGREWYAQLSAFWAEWDASGQIPLRLVDSGRIGRFGAIDPTEGGNTHRADASLGLRSVAGEDARWEVQVFATRYDFQLFSNFTFFLNDPDDGDGIEQVDDRSIAGFRSSYGRPNRLGRLPGRWEVGAGARVDRAEVALFHQRARERLGTRVDDRIAQGHLSGWAEQRVSFSAPVRLSLGVRGDVFRFSVLDRLVGIDSVLPHASGTRWRGIASPRVSLAVDASDRTTLFVSLGSGFHSNDARDVILASGGERVLPRAWGGEVGARSTSSRGSVAVSFWALALASELVYVGDEGVTEASGRTRRAGVDLEGRVRLLPWLWADADLDLSRGRYPDEPPGADYIPLAPAMTSTGGLTVRDLGPLVGGARYRHIGSRPADESGSVRARGYTVWELFGTYSRGALGLTVTVDNLFDTEWNEAQFSTTSRLHHEPHEVTELHFTPGAPRGVQVGIAYDF